MRRPPKPALNLRASRRVIRCAASADQVYRVLSANKEVLVLVADGSELVHDAALLHNCAPTAAAALGRTLIGTLLLSCFKKEGDHVQVTFQGRGSIGTLMAIGSSEGMVKGRLTNPSADPPLRPDGKLDVGTAVGNVGTLSVVRSNPAVPVPYTGIVPITSGEVAEDLAVYLSDSEQTRSALGLGVLLGRDGRVKRAGGYLIEVLPGASDDTLSALEGNLGVLPPITELMDQGLSPPEVADALLMGLGAASEGGATVKPEYGPCGAEGLKERMKQAVALLGREEVDSILAEQGQIEVSCEFCNTTYTFSEEDVADLA